MICPYYQIGQYSWDLPFKMSPRGWQNPDKAICNVVFRWLCILKISVK